MLSSPCQQGPACSCTLAQPRLFAGNVVTHIKLCNLYRFIICKVQKVLIALNCYCPWAFSLSNNIKTTQVHQHSRGFQVPYRRWNFQNFAPLEILHHTPYQRQLGCLVCYNIYAGDGLSRLCQSALNTLPQGFGVFVHIKPSGDFYCLYGYNNIYEVFCQSLFWLFCKILGFLQHFYSSFFSKYKLCVYRSKRFCIVW